MDYEYTLAETASILVHRTAGGLAGDAAAPDEDGLGGRGGGVAGRVLRALRAPPVGARSPARAHDPASERRSTVFGHWY